VYLTILKTPASIIKSLPHQILPLLISVLSIGCDFVAFAKLGAKENHGIF